MLIRSFKRSVPFFVCVWIFMMRTFTIDPNAFKFIGAFEGLLPLLLVPVCAFMLHDRTEIELAMVCGTRTSKLFFSKVIPMITYTVIPCAFFSLVFKSRIDREIDFSRLKKTVIYDFIPEDYRLCAALSVAVTAIFIFAVYSLIRVITRNCYITMLVGFGTGIAIQSFRNTLGVSHGNLTNCLFDPMINTYFIGNSVPNAYAEKFPELASMANIWTYNRLFFLGLSAVIFLITHLILRYEKLHQGLSE